MTKAIRKTSAFVALCTLFEGAVYANEAPDKPRFSADMGYGTLSPRNDNGDIVGLGIPPQSSVDVESSSSVAASISYHHNPKYQLPVLYCSTN